MSRRTRLVSLIAAVACAGAFALFFSLTRFAQAQGIKRLEGNGTLHFSTKLGSFKILSVENEPVTGHLEMTFKGGLLVSGLDHEPKPSGNVRLEYTYAPLKKYAYFGQGKIVLDGPFRSLQWFGSDMDATFVGRAKVRLAGEFDKNLDTGTFWTDDPKKTNNWPANGLIEVLVPSYKAVAGHTETGVPVPHERGGN